MSSRAHVAVDLPTHVIVRIDHGVADSFSRSVIPTSSRTWKRSINCRANTHRIVELAPEWTVNGRMCASFAAFGPSFDAAREALAAYLAAIAPEPVTTEV